MFEFAEVTKDMTASEILNYYRNLYYAEPQVTERGIVANAINDFFADVVPKSEVEWLYQTVDNYSQEVMYHDEITKMKVDEAKAEVAREIFEEIEREINDALQSNYRVLPQIEESEALWNRVNGKIDALRGIDGFVEELKKKYTESEDNAE